jgi:two-component system, OmpR family, sensor histidine kinase KdpD
VPRRKIEYRGKLFEEMDTAAIIARKPEYALVDELAHTNVPGSEHEKRWRDVMLLLEANINVLTTVNIQHLESLNDRVFQITGVQVRETLPDRVVQTADDVVVVDVSTRALMHRLERGVVYSPEKASAALRNFFREGNLGALRELALRQTAETVEDELEGPTGGSRLTGTLECLMVCLHAHPSAATVVRRAKRVADRLHADCYVVHVVPDADWSGHTPDQRKIVEAHLNLARSLNLRTELVYGRDIAGMLVKFAAEHGVTQIFMGRSLRSGWKEFLSRNIIEQVIRAAPNLDIHVVAER